MDAKIAQPQLTKLLARFPNLLSEQEKTLPEDQRALLMRHKINAILAKSQNNNAQDGEDKSGGAGSMVNRMNGNVQAGPSMQARPPLQQQQPPQQQPNPQMHQMPMMGGVNMAQQGSQGGMMNGQNGQPQMVMQNLQSQMGMPQGGIQQMNGVPQQRVASDDQSYQEQMRMQQHQQQQHHMNQRMQQVQQSQQAQIQQVQAQAQALATQVQNSGILQQQQHQHQQPPQQPNLAMPSPQQQPGVMGSPMANGQTIGRSPSTGRSNSISAGNALGAKVLVDSFPKLLELKRAGRLTSEQDKLFDSVMSSEAGRAQLAQFQAAQASAVIQSNLSNQMAHPSSMPQQQMPQQMTPQQQMAQLHHQQQHPNQQQQPPMPMQFPPGMMPNQQQLTQQQLQQQMHMRQQMAQQGMRPPNPANQAQMLARAQLQAQTQLQQAAQQMGPPGMQPNQQHQMEQQAGTPNYGSPRPIPPQAQRPGVSAEKMAQVKATLAKLSQMDEQTREQWFRERPNDRQFWANAMNSNRNQAQLLAQTQNAAPMGQGRPPAGNAPFANTNNANNMANLHIPPNKQRNLSQGNVGSPAAAGTPPMRPPLPLNNPTPQQRAVIQQMLAQGIPVSGGVRPPMSMPQGPQGTGGLAPDIKPQQLINQLKPQPEGGVVPPGAIRRMSDQPPAPLDRTASLLHKTTWAPSSEYDAQLREKLSMPQRPLRPAGRSTLAQGLGVTRILSEVVLERLPEGLNALADDAEAELSGDKKKTEEGSGMPGQKKRKVAELAETIDKQLEVDPHVETVLLSLADEHAELIDNISSLLARHRKSATVDRKDVQLAYEMTESRPIPAFSSDAIRMDQAKSVKRAGASLPPGRIAKLKLVSEAKNSWRKQKMAEREAERVKNDEDDVGDVDMGMDGVEGTQATTPIIDGPVTSTLGIEPGPPAIAA